MQQGYLRKHLVGTGPGRAIGLNLGGLLFTESFVSLNYNVGYFTPNNTSPLNNTGGAAFAPLWVGRAVVSFGDPELTKYKIGYKTNFYNQRKGLSIGFGGAYQGETDIFLESTTLSVDFLFNWGRFNLDGDYHIIQRNDANNQCEARAGHIRASYNMMVGNKIIEPVVMFNTFNGPQSPEEQLCAAILGEYSGTDEALNMGFNYYLNTHKLKLIAHYVVQNGVPGRNSFYSQGALGEYIERGDYFVLGLNAIF